MGKRAKEHRKKVQKRNARIKQMETSFNKKLKEMLTTKLEEYKKEVELIEASKSEQIDETKEENTNNQQK